MSKCNNKTIVAVLFVNFIVLSIAIFLNIYLVTKEDTVSIFNKNILKVVEIKTSNDEDSWGYATGVFVASDGTILTNKHVVNNSLTGSNYKYVKVRVSTENEWIDAEIIKVGYDVDLATIKINRKNTKYFKIHSKILDGETIYTIGNPNGFGLSFTSGVISSSLKNVIYNGNNIKAVQTNFVINEGNSGGPVFNKSGKLIGIISFRLRDKSNEVIQGVSFAIPSYLIKNFLVQ